MKTLYAILEALPLLIIFAIIMKKGLPERKKMNGIDISHYQQGISLAEVRPGFVIAKISEGTTYRDKTFDGFYNDCKELGIPLGAYVYSHAKNQAEGKAEAEYVLSLLAGRKLELPIYLDVEGDLLIYSAEKLMSAALSFAETVLSAGYRAGVYASLSAYRSKFDVDALRARGVSIWLAHWDVDAPGMDCDIWQSCTGRISGYSGEIDLDVMRHNIIEDEKVHTACIMDPVRAGDHTPEAAYLMGLLNKLGYDVLWDGLENCIRDFQQKRGLEVTGVCGENTWKELLK